MGPTQPKTATRRGGARKGAGRKMLSGHQIRLRVNSELYDAICSAAHQAGLTPAVWTARHVTLTLPAQAAPNPPAPAEPDLETLPVPTLAKLEADVGAVAAYEAVLDGQVAIIPESKGDSLIFVVWFFPHSLDKSPTYIAATSRDEAEIIARVTALATQPSEAGGYGLLG